MELMLVSQQFVFEDGDVNVLQHAHQSTSPYLSSRAEVHANRIDHLNAVVGDVKLLFQNCRVTSLATRAVRRIPSMVLSVHIAEKVLAEGHAEVFVGFHAFVRIELVDPAGRPVRSRAVVGVALEESTIEAPASDDGHLDILVKPGSYSAYVLDRSPVPTVFAVEDGKEEGGTVRLSA